ncbi:MULTISPECIES: hypothetical protein, partial [unclassified Streptomyces]|uniref:hypothetical protein n=1 Tax=unclassified Streptomyces TaxID=2593676 RepID=UPI001A8DC8D0
KFEQVLEAAGMTTADISAQAVSAHLARHANSPWRAEAAFYGASFKSSIPPHVQQGKPEAAMQDWRIHPPKRPVPRRL